MYTRNNKLYKTVYNNNLIHTIFDKEKWVYNESCNNETIIYTYHPLYKQLDIFTIEIYKTSIKITIPIMQSNIYSNVPYNISPNTLRTSSNTSYTTTFKTIFEAVEYLEMHVKYYDNKNIEM